MKRNSKGFTLAELLIVVAIIAILVAVSIPIFTGSREKAELNTATYNAATASRIAKELKMTLEIDNINGYMSTAPSQSEYKEFDAELFKALDDTGKKTYVIWTTQDSEGTIHTGVNYFPDGDAPKGHYYNFQDGKFFGEYNK